MADRTTESRDPRPRRASLAAKLAAVGVVALLLASGTFLLGRVATDATTAMALTAAWFAIVGAAAWLIGRRRHELRLYMAGGFLAMLVLVGVLIGLPTVVDKTVDEPVVTGAPTEPASASDGGSKRGADKPPGNVELARGAFKPLAHPGSGEATVVELPSGDRRLTLTDFETDNGPDLFVYLTSDDVTTGEVGEFENLGRLKGNRGNQEYRISEGVDLKRYSTVVVWCRAFSVAFTKAPFERS